MTVHISQKDLAQRWNLSPRTLERWRWLKRGPTFVKIGGSIRYRLEDIQSYEQANIRSLTLSGVESVSQHCSQAGTGFMIGPLSLANEIKHHGDMVILREG